MYEDLIRVLLVEDDEDDYILTRALLEGSIDPLVELDWAATYAEAQATIARSDHHLYLIDFDLGATTGLDLIREARIGGAQQPMILLTAMADRRIDLAATAAGASGFLLKPEMSVPLLERTIRYALNRGGRAGFPSRPFSLPTRTLPRHLPYREGQTATSYGQRPNLQWAP